MSEGPGKSGAWFAESGELPAEMPESMQILLEQAGEAYKDAARRAQERRAERSNA